MSKVYSIQFEVAATAYIRADNAADAKQIALKLQGLGLEVKDAGGDVEISGLAFDDPALPAVSLSPAMTMGDLGLGLIATLECVHDGEPNELADYRPSETLEAGDIPYLRCAGYTVNHKEGHGWVFNDPDGNDDKTAFTMQTTAWIAAKRDERTRPQEGEG